MIFSDASRQQRASRNSAKRLSTHVIIDLSRCGRERYRLKLIDDEKRTAQRYYAREKYTRVRFVTRLPTYYRSRFAKRSIARCVWVNLRNPFRQAVSIFSAFAWRLSHYSATLALARDERDIVTVFIEK